MTWCICALIFKSFIVTYLMERSTKILIGTLTLGNIILHWSFRKLKEGLSKLNLYSFPRLRFKMNSQSRRIRQCSGCNSIPTREVSDKNLIFQLGKFLTRNFGPRTKKKLTQFTIMVYTIACIISKEMQYF